MSERRHRQSVLSWSVGALIAGFAASAQAEVVSLAQLEESALKNRPALAREDARALAADADLQKAASAYYPQFGLKGTVDVGPGRQLLSVTGGDGRTYLVPGAPSLTNGGGGNAFLPALRTGLELSANANLYDFGRTKAAMDAGREGHAAALANRSLTEAELRQAVRQSYLAWLLQHELVRLARDGVQEAKQRRERVAALISEGAKPKGELTPTRAEELLAELELQRAERELAAARIHVEYSVGTSLAGSAEPDASMLNGENSLPDSSEQHVKNMRALEQRMKATRAFADAQAKLNRPQLGLGVSAGIRTSTQKVTDLPTLEEQMNGARPHSGTDTTVFPLYGAGLTLSIPLWDGGLTKASAEAARARANEAKADLQEFEQAQDLAQREAEIDVESARARLATTEELIAVCSARLKDAEAGYELGASSIDLIAQARGLLRRAKTEALIARVDHAAARLRMVRKDAAPPE